MSQRLPDSKRNELIADYLEGKIDSEYEVIPSKTTKGKYTVRKRKVALPQSDNLQPAPVEESKEENPAPEPAAPEPEEDELEPEQYGGYNMYQEYQMMLNKMMIEQMKMMRKQIKYNNKKQKKLKGKSRQVFDLLKDLATAPEPEEEKEEPVPEQHQEEEEHVEEEEVQENTTKIFDNDYKNKEPVKEYVPPKPAPEPEKPNYKQEYEAKIDEIGGFTFRLPSRRDRLNFKNFNI